MEFLHILAAKIDANTLGVPKVGAENVLSGVLGTVYWAAGITAVVVLIVAGILYVTADADSANLKRAKHAVLYSVVGLLVVMMAFVITNFVIGRF